MENEVIEKSQNPIPLEWNSPCLLGDHEREDETSKHRPSLLPALALSPLTLFPFNQTCSSADNILAAADSIVWDVEQVLLADEQICSPAHKHCSTAEQILFTDERICSTVDNICSAVERVLSTCEQILLTAQAGNTMRVHPNGTVWLCNIGSNQIIRLDPKTKKVD